MTTSYPALHLYIDGAWTDGTGGGEDVLNPATEETLAALPHASAADLDRALAAAQKGFAVWRGTAPAERAAVMHRAAALLRERKTAIATVLTLEQGKPLDQSRAEVDRAADIIEWDAEEGRRAYGSIIPASPGFRQLAYRQPIGPVAAFTPWNFPISSPARKVGAALAAGNAIVLKASEEVPGAACALVQAFHDVGLPAGVLNLVFGVPAEVSEHLIPSPVIRMVTLTGSIPVGKQLATLAAAHMKPVVMELGGHSPVIVCDDADAEAAATAAVTGKFRNAGQVCVSPTRFIVHESLHDAFVERFAAGVQDIRVGNGLEDGVTMGPLANSRRLEAMERLVADAVQRGATVAAGGERIGNRGYYFQPTVLTDVATDAAVMNEEPFGPLAPVTRFRDVDEAIAEANRLPFGLASYAFTESANTAAVLSDRVESGIMSINHLGGSLPETPFGGVKESGYGREGGDSSLDAFLVTKFVSHKVAA